MYMSMLVPFFNISSMTKQWELPCNLWRHVPHNFFLREINTPASSVFTPFSSCESSLGMCALAITKPSNWIIFLFFPFPGGLVEEVVKLVSLVVLPAAHRHLVGFVQLDLCDTKRKVLLKPKPITLQGPLHAKENQKSC